MTDKSCAGVVLCGGRSLRMGRPKHLLQLGDGQTFLEACLEALNGVVDQVVVSIATGRSLSGLPANVRVVEDEHAEGSGPLAGIAAAIQAMEAESAIVLSCDAPLIKSAILRLLFEWIRETDVAVASIAGHEQYFPGVYQRSTGKVAERLLSRGEHRMSALIAECNCCTVSEDQIRAIDPDLDSFFNVNTPQDYDAILQRKKRR